MDHGSRGSTDAEDSGTDVVRLEVPAQYRSLRIVRLTASGVAGEAGFDIDAIEDLRVAIDEASAVLVASAAPGARLAVELVARAGGVEARGRCAVSEAPEVHPVAADVLSLLTERCSFDQIDDGASSGVSSWEFVLIARRGGLQVSDDGG